MAGIRDFLIDTALGGVAGFAEADPARRQKNVGLLLEQLGRSAAIQRALRQEEAAKTRGLETELGIRDRYAAAAEERRRLAEEAKAREATQENIALTTGAGLPEYVRKTFPTPAPQPIPGGEKTQGAFYGTGIQAPEDVAAEFSNEELRRKAVEELGGLVEAQRLDRVRTAEKAQIQLELERLNLKEQQGMALTPEEMAQKKALGMRLLELEVEAKRAGLPTGQFGASRLETEGAERGQTAAQTDLIREQIKAMQEGRTKAGAYPRGAGGAGSPTDAVDLLKQGKSEAELFAMYTTGMLTFPGTQDFMHPDDRLDITDTLGPGEELNPSLAFEAMKDRTDVDWDTEYKDFVAALRQEVAKRSVAPPVGATGVSRTE
jgi:hypothetical protein